MSARQEIQADVGPHGNCTCVPLWFMLHTHPKENQREKMTYWNLLKKKAPNFWVELRFYYCEVSHLAAFPTPSKSPSARCRGCWARARESLTMTSSGKDFQTSGLNMGGMLVPATPGSTRTEKPVPQWVVCFSGQEHCGLSSTHFLPHTAHGH